MAYDSELADRIRARLSKHASVREVVMFGGLGFMLNNKLALFAHGDGGLWLRAAPHDQGELQSRGAEPAAMGTGRGMGAGWLAVPPQELDESQQLDFWVRTAEDWNRRISSS